jgi:Leucine-rich repeat (LRR) protein
MNILSNRLSDFGGIDIELLDDDYLTKNNTNEELQLLKCIKMEYEHIKNIKFNNLKNICPILESIILKDLCAEINFTNLNITMITLINIKNINQLDFSGCINLRILQVEKLPLEKIILEDCVNLEKLTISYTKITILNLESNIKLKEIDTSNNLLSNILLNQNNNIEELDLHINNFIELDLSSCEFLTYINVSYNKLTSIDLSNCISLTNILLLNNNLTNIYVSHCKMLNYIILSYNYISDINVLYELSNIKTLTYLYFQNNPLKFDHDDITELYKLFENTNMEELRLSKKNNIKLKIYLE